MSDTPETENEIRTPKMYPGYLGESEIVDASFAKRLEKERNAAQNLADKLKAALHEADGQLSLIAYRSDYEPDRDELKKLVRRLRGLSRWR